MFCSKCGKEIQDGALFCNNCGEKQSFIAETKNRKKSKTLFWGCLMVFIIWGFIFNAIQCKPKNDSTSPQKVYKIGQVVKLPNLSYIVKRTKWRKSIGNDYYSQSADAKFLLIDIVVKNNSKEIQSIPDLTLIDENGAEYQETKGLIAYDGRTFLFDSLNPGVHTSGTIFFDVPSNHKYKLQLNDSEMLGDSALVDISKTNKHKSK